MPLILTRHALDRYGDIFIGEGGVREGLVSEVLGWLGSEHAHFLARAEVSDRAIRWVSEGERSLSWRELTPSQREALLVASGSIISDFRRAAEEHPDSLLAKYFPSWRQFPSLDHLYAVDGKPVMTAWGYADHSGTVQDPLAAYDDGLPFKPSPIRAFRSWRTIPFPWITALIAFLVGLGLALLKTMLVFPTQSCVASYPPISAIQQAQQTQERHQQMVERRDGLLSGIRQLNTQCQLPPVQPLVPKTLPPIAPLPDTQPPPTLPVPKQADLPPVDLPQRKDQVPPPPSAQKADLPQDSWKKKDTSMLNGCWHLTTHLDLYQRTFFFGETHQPVTSWSLCFNPNGNGKQVLTRADGRHCTGPLQAGFEGDRLIIKQPAECQGQFTLIQGQNVCTRLNDREARCTYIDGEGSRATGIFRR